MERITGIGGTAAAVGTAATNIAEIFNVNQTRRMELDEEAYARAITQMGVEFQSHRGGWFDSFVNGLNRLPRPVLTMGTLGLFVYAMTEPEGFGLRMENLNLVPEPLWWLLGAIISFYFGAREAHYYRVRGFNRTVARNRPETTRSPASPKALASRVPVNDDFADNAALRDWAATL
ncbi:holin family protein [Paracoccus sp. DMF-8]|uniref:holin family protein n=1 Tax=Paracoccus sp. DMF-8 TaxID=3019445 RepID=UPI0023E7FC9B|nr:holin family protein [Paracoccus sp. DMF-8]MDF3606188.1 holin family protein [Paracoccus sp. DMF-8]